jgi:hypothetical protein
MKLIQAASPRPTPHYAAAWIHVSCSNYKMAQIAFPPYTCYSARQHSSSASVRMIIRSAWINSHTSQWSKPYSQISFELLAPEYKIECWRLHRGLWWRRIKCTNYLSLLSQKSIVTCCRGYGRKWIIGLTSAVSQRANIEHLWNMERKKLGEFLFPSVGRLLQSFPPFKYTDFMKCAQELRITLQ